MVIDEGCTGHIYWNWHFQAESAKPYARALVADWPWKCELRRADSVYVNLGLLA